MIGSLGVPEIIFILVLALLVFGPKRLPEIGRTLGKGLAEFRKASNELKRTINAELALDEAETPRPRRVPPTAFWPDDPEEPESLPPAVVAAAPPGPAAPDHSGLDGQAVTSEALDPK